MITSARLTHAAHDGEMDLTQRLTARVHGLVQRFDSALTRARHDGWSNIITGLGHETRDKRMFGTVAAAPMFGEAFLSELYSGDGMAKRIVDLPVKEQTREWIRFSSDSPSEQNKGVLQALQVLGAQRAIREGLAWGRLYGGAIVLLGADDGRQLWQPLQTDRIRSFDWLSVMDRYEIDIAARYQDLKSGKRGQPQFYRVVNPGSGVE